MARAEFDHQVLRVQAGRQVQVRTSVGGLVVVDDLHGRRTAGRARQGNAHTRHQAGTHGEHASRFARGIKQIAKTAGQIDACQRGQRRQVQVDLEIIAVLKVQCEVDVQAVIGHVQRQVKQTCRNAQSLLDDLLGFVQCGGRGVRCLFDARQQLVAKVQDVAHRAVDQWQLLRVERLAAHGSVHHIGHGTQAAHDVLDAQAAQIGDGGHIGQDDHHIVGRNAVLEALRRIADVELAGGHQLALRPVEQVLHIQAQLEPCAHIDAGTAGLDRQALQARIGVARDVEVQPLGARVVQLLAREELAAHGVGRPVQGGRELGAQVHLRAAAHTTGLQRDKAQLGQHLQIGDIGRDACCRHEMVDGNVKVATGHQHQVEVHADIHTDRGDGIGAQRQIRARCQVQVQRRGELRQLHFGADRDHQMAGVCVVAGFLVAQHAGLVDRRHKLTQGADALNALVHRVRAGRVAGGVVARQRHAGAIHGHRQDLQHLIARRDKKALHGGSKLPGHAAEHRAALGDGRRAGGQLGLPGGRHPFQHRPVEVDLVDHACFKGARDVQKLVQRFFNERQAAQTQLGHVHGLQVIQHIGDGHQHILDLDFREVRQFVQARGLEHQSTGQGIARHRDLARTTCLTGQIHTRQGGINWQAHGQHVLARRELEFTVMHGQTAAQIELEAALLVCIAKLVGAQSANAHIQRPQTRRQHQAVGFQAALEGQLVQVKTG